MMHKPRAGRKHRPIVRYHGGKAAIAEWIISFFPSHECYTEGFGGGGSVLLRKPQSRAEIYNDLDVTMVHLFRTIQDPAHAAELIRLLELTPFSRAEFILAREPTDDPVERARRTIIRSHMGYGSDGTTGIYPTGFRTMVSHAKKTPAAEWANYPAALRTIVERFKLVTVEQKDAFVLLPQQDSPTTLHYVDPPYVPSTRSQGNRRRGKGYHVYAHELDEADHVRLLTMLRALDGMVVLSGYPCDLYNEMLADWHHATRKAYADSGRERVEGVWINPAAVAGLARDRRDGPLFA